ncbi:Phage Tail Protein X [Vibrio xiamenensis]|uniref:Phage Tail Protein X n=1 Tax=Vibrio xiamenensis TaxID=861298 RepID=A0A1G8HXC6_9VIBR|nr:tail protein X [Vibrio xiamenensis]SDI11365.1 Phage Tail Protein X [Vibrio xiamenensis]
MSIALSIVGDTVGDVLYRYFQEDGDDLERQLYELNPHLKKLPVLLPTGTRIQLPEVSAESELEVERVVTVWD